VFLSSLVMAVSLVILAFTSDVFMLSIAAAVMGAGFGAYTAVDLAMISLVLPRPEDRSKDLGIVNIAVRSIPIACCAVTHTAFPFPNGW
jgi:MFS family permease